MNNITVSACTNGLVLHSVIDNGKVSNVYAYNCYSTGIVTYDSYLTLENIKFANLGGVGIEIAPTRCNNAGINNDEKQKITILGTIDAINNVNNSINQSQYFSKYNVATPAGTLPALTILQGALVEKDSAGNRLYTDAQIMQMVKIKADGSMDFAFVSFIFNDLATGAPNVSEVYYPGYQSGGIIEAKNLPKDGSIDTTHQFISIPVVVSGIPVGTALFYNQNYVAQ